MDGVVIAVIRVLVIAGGLSRTLPACPCGLAPPAVLRTSSLDLLRGTGCAGTSWVFSRQAYWWCRRWRAVLRANGGLFIATVCSLRPIGCGLTLWGWAWPWLCDREVKITQISHTTYTTSVAMGMWSLTHFALRFVPWAPLWSGSHPPPQAYVLHCCPWHWTLDCSCTQTRQKSVLTKKCYS